MWLKGSASHKLNPFPNVFFLFQLFDRSSTPPKPQRKGGESGIAKMDFLHRVFLSLQSGLPMDHINTPISRVSCLNVEYPENQADQFWASLPKIQIYYTTYYIHYILEPVCCKKWEKKSQPRNLFWE